MTVTATRGQSLKLAQMAKRIALQNALRHPEAPRIDPKTGLTVHPHRECIVTFRSE